MNLKALLENNTNISVTVSLVDLKEFGLSLINETKAAQKEEQVEESYLSPDEVSQMIGVSKNTLWRWERDSYLIPVKVGRKSRYRLSDVKAVLEGRG